MEKQFALQLETLKSDIIARFQELIPFYGTESRHSSDNVLKIDKDNLMFNLEGGRYLTEIAVTYISDNLGYRYEFELLTIEELCEVADYFDEQDCALSRELNK